MCVLLLPNLDLILDHVVLYNTVTYQMYVPRVTSVFHLDPRLVLPQHCLLYSNVIVPMQCTHRLEYYYYAHWYLTITTIVRAVTHQYNNNKYGNLSVCVLLYLPSFDLILDHAVSYSAVINIFVPRVTSTFHLEPTLVLAQHCLYSNTPLNPIWNCSKLDCKLTSLWKLLENHSTATETWTPWTSNSKLISWEI